MLEALHTLNAKILRPLCAACDKSEYEFKARKISVEPFAFSEETRKEPTQFEVFFRTDAAEYCYILHMRQDFVMHESLYRIKLDTGRRSALFVRNGSEVDLKGVFGKIKISGEISENLPLLSYLGITYKRNEIISDVIQCKKTCLDYYLLLLKALSQEQHWLLMS